MQVTFDLKELMLGLVLLALFVLLIAMIVLVINLIPSIKQLKYVLSDVNKISTVAADKTEKLGGVIDNAGNTVMNLTDNLKGNSTLIGKATNIGAGLASAKSLVGANGKSKEDKEYLKRAKERKSDKEKDN